MKYESLLFFVSFMIIFSCINTTRVMKNSLKEETNNISLLMLNKKIFNHAKSKSNQKSFNSFAKNFKFKSKNSKITVNSSLSVDLATPCVPQENSCPNIMAGWLKYIEITDVVPDVPNSFIKNKQFYLQQAQNQSMNTQVKDNFGFINIPNEDYFYFELNKEQLKIFSARTPRYRKIDRFLNLRDLIHETSLNPAKGGVEDVGNFAEGYCFMLKFTHFTRFFVWELCADTPWEKDKWMGTLSKLNEIHSRENMMTHQISQNNDRSNANHSNLANSQLQVNQIIGSFSPIPLQVGGPIPGFAPVTQSGVPAIAGVGVIGTGSGVLGIRGSQIGVSGPIPLSGVVTSGTLITNRGNALTIATTHGPGWIPAEGWGPCSEPCGPGIQSRKLKCIQDDGCNGGDYEERMCNIKECKRDLDDHLNKLKQVAECGQWKLLGEWGPCSRPCGGGVQFRKRECVPANLPCIGKSVISQPCNMKVCRIVDIPDCKQIEGQLDLILNMEKKPVPVHLIVNINEVMIQQEPLLAPLAAIPLDDLTNIQLANAKAALTNLVGGSNSGSGNNGCCFNLGNKADQKNYSLCPEDNAENSCNGWMDKILKFKENCNNKILDKITSDLEKGNCDHDPSKKLADMNKQAVEAEREKTQDQLLQLDNKFKDFKRQVNEILDKEDSYESKLIEQEKTKECKEKKATEDLIKKQEDAARMLLDDLSSIHKADNEYSLREKAVQREMREMMAEVRRKIADKRNTLVGRLQRMKTLHELDQKRSAHKLLDLKKEFGKKLGNMAHKGNPEQCFNINDSKSIDCYCNNNFRPADLNSDCKNPQKFCYMCCDHEVGSMDQNNLECCYNRCESISAKLNQIGNTKCSGFLETYHIPPLTSIQTVSSCKDGRC